MPPEGSGCRNDLFGNCLSRLLAGRIFALKVPDAQNAKGYCLDIFIESQVVGERVAWLRLSKLAHFAYLIWPTSMVHK